MKKIIVLAAVLMLYSGTQVFAYDNDTINPVASPYEMGCEYLHNDQYTKAISEFKKALHASPSDESSRIQITNAYLARAAYYNNKMLEYKNAANDLRSALFYMKYYDVTPVDPQTINNIHITESNLNNALNAINADTTPQGRFNSGKALRAQGEFAAAVSDFQISQKEPKLRKDSLLALGEIYYLMNLNEQASTFLERVLYDDPQNPDAHLKLARVYEKMGAAEKAAKEYSFALNKSTENQDILVSLENIWKQRIQIDPDDSEAHANLGTVYQKKGNLELAMQEYQKAEKINPSNANTRLNLGTLYQEKKQYDVAIEAYDSILRLYPNYTQAYYYKAQCLKALGYEDAAIQNYKLAANLEPSNKNIQDELYQLYQKNLSPEEKLKLMGEQAKSEPNDADKVYNYAYELHKANKIDEAITYYNQALKLDADNADTYINLAIVYKMKSDYTNAAKILKSGLSKFPDNEEMKKQLGVIDAEMTSIMYSDASTLFNQKKYKEALAMYQKITPSTAESLVGMGACYQALNSHKSAIEAYKKAFEKEPQNSDIAYYLALAYSDDDSNTNAKLYAQKALILDATNKSAKELLNYLEEEETAKMLSNAIAVYEKKDYSQAFDLFTKVLSRNPKEANAHYYCGLMYDDQKKYWPAIESYKKAVQTDSSMNIALYSIAVDYDYLGKYNEAVTYFKKYAASTNEVNDYTKYAKKRIQELKQYDTPQAANTQHK